MNDEQDFSSMAQHPKEPVVACFLWLKQQKGDGQFYLTGRMGALRVIISPVENAPDGAPGYCLRFAESDRAISPDQLRWMTPGSAAA